MPTMPDPASSNLYSGHDIDETRLYLSNALGRNINVQPLPDSAFEANISAYRTGPLRIVSASYPYGLERGSSDGPDDISLSIIKRGSASISFPASVIELASGDVAIFNSAMIESSRFHPGATNCFLTITKTEVESFLETVLDRRLLLPADIGITLLRDTAEARLVTSLAAAIEDAVAACPDLYRSAHALRLLREATVMSIVEAIPAHRQWFDAAPARPATWQIRQALDFIAAQSGPVTIHDVAETAGIGVRALQIAFQEQLGATPQAYLKQVRLEAVRAALKDPDRGKTVGEIARAWGFSNMSRFAAEYEQAFGVRPAPRKSKRQVT